GAWLTALALSPVVPTTLAIAGDRYHRFAGTIFSLLFTLGSFGGMLFSWTLGRVSEAAGVRLGMTVPLVGAVAVTLCGLAVMQRRGATEHR
ncbi:MAG TPA: hypothetical protein VK911_03525, partial [Vicinamibacterales bacterium]|nr:hypothetical protein [Vicinamibacterales bacterium]